MHPSSYQYRKLRAAHEDRDSAHAAALRAQQAANDNYGLPKYDALQEIADEAAEKYLRADGKVEYLEAVVDFSREDGKRRRPADSPTPIDILVRQQRDQAARVRAHRIRKGFPLFDSTPLPAAPPARAADPILFLTYEQAQAESDARRAAEHQKEAERAARQERRRQKSAERTAAWRKKNAQR